MNRFIHTLALLMILGGGLLAQQQSFTGYVEAGDKASQRSDHYSAFKYYTLAADEGWSDDPAYEEEIANVYYKAGLAAFRATAYGEAERYMLKLQNLPDASRFSLIKYYIAETAFRTGNYDQAALTFRSFLDDQPRAPEDKRAAALERINDANWAADAAGRGEEVSLRHLPEGINTADSDVMYVRGPSGSRYYSTNGFEFKEDSLQPKRMLSKIMLQTGETTGEAVPKLINVPNKSVANAAFNGDFSQVYYQVCEFQNEQYDELICDLYRADIGADGNWINPVKLDLNVAGYSTAMPNVGTDLSDGKEYLFFSSNRPGGAGDMDIYRAEIASDGSIAAPENLTNINTGKTEATPFWYGPRHTLYFATDGLFTYGGLDVHKAYHIDGSFRSPINVGDDVNSPANDAYYTRFDDPDQAYVASRRASEEAIYYSDERDVCCYDLYEFTPDPRIDLQVLTFNELSREELEGVTVALYKVTPSGPELVEETTNLENNIFNFRVEPGEKYELKAVKDGFTEALDAFDLGSEELKDLPLIERQMYLAPTVKLEVFTFNNIDDAELPGATVMLYEVNEDGSLTLLEEVTNPTGNDAYFDLKFGKNYRVEAEKPGFGQAFTTVDLRELDPDQSGTIRRDLYLGQSLEVYVIDGRTDEPLDMATLKLLKYDGELINERTNETGNDFYYTVNLDQPFVLETTRPDYFPRTDTLRFTEADLIDGDGKLVYIVPLFNDRIEDFLPFQVYFDNDHPNPDAYRSTTDLSYDETYFPYIAKEEEFREGASQGMSEEDAFVAKGRISLLFDQDVKAGWKQLQRFSDALIQYLRNGNSFTVELQGHASPRAPSEYNRRLSARRNMSLKNFFRTYKDGVLEPYIEGGQLSFRDTALGETTAKLERIYSRLDRERESIYSRLASLERRVTLKSGLATKKK